MAKEMLAPFDQPWPIFAKALPQWPLVKFDIMTKKKVQQFEPNLAMQS